MCFPRFIAAIEIGACMWSAVEHTTASKFLSIALYASRQSAKVRAFGKRGATASPLSFFVPFVSASRWRR